MSDRWTVFERYEQRRVTAVAGFGQALVVTQTGEPFVGDDEPSFYFVADYRDSTKRREGDFATYEEAQAAADEANRFDAQGPLDPNFEQRRFRLKGLAPDFGYLYEGPSEARWPIRPGKYLLDCMGHGWHPSSYWELADTVDDVKAQILDDEQTVFRVIDLDTGAEVEFKRTVLVDVSV